jgi:hypothetical protein
LLGLSDEVANERFGFLLNAFKYGVPPHGGMAYGLDRLVMLMAKTDNIRDVVAFPKTNSATCLMSNAPDVVEEIQLKDLKNAIDNITSAINNIKDVDGLDEEYKQLDIILSTFEEKKSDIAKEIELLEDEAFYKENEEQWKVEIINQENEYWSEAI